MLGLALHANGPAVLLYQTSGDRQPQTRTFPDTFGGRTDLMKLVEDRVVFFRGNAHTSVRH